MSRRGSTAVTPVRTGPCPTFSAPSPLTIVAWPTSTPATSVMALRRPVGNAPTTMLRSRARMRAPCAVGSETAATSNAAVANNRFISTPSARWQREGDVLARIVAAADGDDDVLLAVHEVGHRQPALRRDHPHGADLLAFRLLVGAQHRAARVIGRRRDLRIAHHHQRLGHHQPDAGGAGLPGLRDVDALQHRMIAN